ncbi:hypothetical protein HDU96_007121 [Phlyctochytrium bullatum]|nr:hypothetical protein HDU96_007121 [Phlyctochytrium bullatum]
MDSTDTGKVRKDSGMIISTTPAKFLLLASPSPAGPSDSPVTSPVERSETDAALDLSSTGANVVPGSAVETKSPPVSPLSTVSIPLDSGVHLPMLAVAAAANAAALGAPAGPSVQPGPISLMPLLVARSNASSSTPASPASQLTSNLHTLGAPSAAAVASPTTPTPAPGSTIGTGNPLAGKSSLFTPPLSPLAAADLGLPPTPTGRTSTTSAPIPIPRTTSHHAYVLRGYPRDASTDSEGTIGASSSAAAAGETPKAVGRTVLRQPSSNFGESVRSSMLASSDGRTLWGYGGYDALDKGDDLSDPMDAVPDPSLRAKYAVKVDSSGQPVTVNTDMSTLTFAIRVPPATPAASEEKEAVVVLKRIHDPVLAKEEAALLKLVQNKAVPHTLRVLDVLAPEELEAFVVGWVEPSPPPPQLDGAGCMAPAPKANGKEGPLIVMPALEKFSSKSLDLCEVALVARQLFMALEGLHSLGIAHLDVTMANLMRDPTCTDSRSNLVLIDYGLARFCKGPSDLHPAGRGTCGYVAPEILDGTGFCTKADLYSAGVVLGQLLEPYLPGMSLQYLGSRLVRPTTTTFVSKKLRDVVDARDRKKGYLYTPLPSARAPTWATDKAASVSAPASDAPVANNQELPPQPPVVKSSGTPFSLKKPAKSTSNLVRLGGSVGGFSGSYPALSSLAMEANLSAGYLSTPASPHLGARHGADHAVSTTTIDGTGAHGSADSITDEECEVVADDAIRHAADLLSRLLEPDPAQRISACQALAHPFVKMLYMEDGVTLRKDPRREVFVDASHKHPGFRLLGGGGILGGGKKKRRDPVITYR